MSLLFSKRCEKCKNWRRHCNYIWWIAQLITHKGMFSWSARNLHSICVLPKKVLPCGYFILTFETVSDDWPGSFAEILISKTDQIDQNWHFWLIFGISKHLKGQLWPCVCQSRFCLFLPHPLPHLRGQLWPRVCQSRFCLFLPRPLPHLRGQLWPRVCQSRFSFRNIEIKKYRNIEIQNYRNIEIQNCILARRSSLGLPPGGRHRT